MAEDRQNLAHVLGLGMQFGLMVAFTLAGLLIGGVYLDRIFGTKPLFMILGIVLGFVGSIAEIFYVVLPILEKKQKVTNKKNNNK
jgi:F0F1-type ATP synthase assembly protein I